MKHYLPLLASLYASLYEDLSEQRQLMSSVLAAELPEEQGGLLLRYLELILDWNERVDLVAPAPTEKLIERHLVDSLAAAMLLSGLRPDSGLIDIGSGAGLPGIVLSIMQPTRKVVLLEPRQKRSVFLNEAKRRLGLGRASVVTSRLENAPTDACEGVAVGVFRALTPTPALLSALGRLLGPHGAAAYLGGPSSTIEGANVRQVPYRLGANGPDRKLIISSV
ncbi:MAG: 16S rRNA (guanine(527)-N(7))-methyltransferase RsmG [Bdellovibrionota bacterium]